MIATHKQSFEKKSQRIHRLCIDSMICVWTCPVYLYGWISLTDAKELVHHNVAGIVHTAHNAPFADMRLRQGLTQSFDAPYESDIFKKWTVRIMR